ncbi:MAG: hypothetical protein MUE65_06580 [Methanomassiliicoccales archaeon]|nr:hypothetical protein [Methanomassiliicoccales archaeon]
MHYGTSTRFPPEEVMNKAVVFFSALGLNVTKRSASTLTMEGGRGKVSITLTPGEDTEVDIISHELNAEVKAFLQRIG